MSLEVAARIGARRSGCDMRSVDVAGLVSLAERTALAFQVLTGAPLERTRDLVRLQLMQAKHSSYFEAPINEHAWFESFWCDVKYPEAAMHCHKRALRVLIGGGERAAKQRKPRLRLVQGGAR